MNSNDPLLSQAPYAHPEYGQRGVDSGLIGYGSHPTDIGHSQDGLAPGVVPGSYGPGWYADGEAGGTGAYEPWQYGTDAYDTAAVSYDAHDAQSAYQASYGFDGFDATGTWEASGFATYEGIPAQPGPAASDLGDLSAQWGTTQGADSTGYWNSGSYVTAGFSGEPQTWDQTSYTDPGPSVDSPQAPDFLNSPAEEWPGEALYDLAPETEPDRTAVFEPAFQDGEGDSAAVPAAVIVGAPPVSGRATGRRNRRAPARRSALLTIALPSVAVMGMAGVAAASVNGPGDTTVQAAPAAQTSDPAAANSKLDTQLGSLTASADDFADRASRTQERIDLTQRREEDDKKREAEAARKKAEAASKEAMRPKFALPVAQKGVGELFGAAGSMWSNRHTGLDFPVPMNTPVMAVTDGTVTAKWNQFYGNMVIVTAPDGTATWYCHLASAKIRSGSVKAGDVIAYAGSSGNSSGPHLHLEVHPGGGDAVDPLRWLRGHDLDPT